MKAVVQQIGARMDYAVPRAFHSVGSLGRLVTDLHFNSRPPFNKLQRYCSGLPAELVSSDTAAGLAYRAAINRAGRSYWPHLKAAEGMASRTLEAVAQTGANVVYGFDTAMLPSMDALRERGVAMVLEQCIAPRAQFLSAMEQLRAKLYRLDIAADLGALDAEIALARVCSSIEQEEWRHADRIYCASEFVSGTLQARGVDPARIRVIPYGVTLDASSLAATTNRNSKPRVVFCGRFSWRKGALEFGLMANQLKDLASFEVLGLPGMPNAMMDAIAPDIVYHGHLDREAFLRSLGRADLMVLPSYSEGSATVVYEAMALGVPCVVTAESGSVITSGKDGLIVPAGDEAALTAAVNSVLENMSQMREVGEQAKATASAYTRESYGARVVEAMQLDFPGEVEAGLTP